MSFLSATLLLGALAAGVPVVLHLMARQPPRRVVFPSVRFLQPHLTTQTSRLKVRRWWLLALRILALVALAIVLARPHIDPSMSSQWTTIGLLGLAGVGLFAMASVALVRGLARLLTWSLFAAALIAMAIAGVGAVGALASGLTPEMRIEQPTAIAIVIDNSPSSAWRVEQQRPDPIAEGRLDERDVASIESADTVTGTRLAVAIARAGELISRLPAGSRIAIVDRSGTPSGFSLDDSAARARLARLTAVADPAPLADRISTAIELVRTSDLNNRHVVIVSDMAAATWEEELPASLARSPLAPAKHPDVPISVLNVHETLRLRSETTGESSAGLEPKRSLNTWLSLPVVADVAPPSGIAIPIRFDIGVWSSGNENSGANDGTLSGGDAFPKTATVQLSLYQRDLALPVVRDGKVVLPPLRTVDRASIDLAGNASSGASRLGRTSGAFTEVILTLPPLERGTHHAVIELVGADRFSWDNRRYLTIDLPTPPKVLVVGDDRDEVEVTAATLTAPYPPDDPAASYRIETAAYVDLGAVDWKRFQMVLLIDPPLSIGSRARTANKKGENTNTKLSSAILEEVAGMVARGGGLLVALGPSVDLGDVVSSPDKASGDSRSDGLLPPIVRSWRIPAPGTFWRIEGRSHPVFESIMRPTSMPNWSDFRVTRYWQTDPSAAADEWEVLARYASQDDGSTDHAAVLTRSLGAGRVAVVTTPLPALGPTTRTWNDLFGAADAWPAFMTVRNLAAYLSGADQRGTTILNGETAIVSLGRGDADASAPSDPSAPGASDGSVSTLQLFAPQQPTSRAITWTPPSVVIDAVDVPGTYFLRGSEVWSGVSANLPTKWSSGDVTNLDSLQAWLGEENWSLADQLESLSLAGGTGGSSAVSLHGPLTLLALLVFLAEQILSNRFYGATRKPGAA